MVRKDKNYMERKPVSETTITRHVMQWINSLDNGFCIKEHGDHMSKAGIPDIICSIDGLFVAIEMKRPGEVPSPLQQYMIDSINRKGGHAFVASSLDEVQCELAALCGAERIAPQARQDGPHAPKTAGGHEVLNCAASFRYDTWGHGSNDTR